MSAKNNIFLLATTLRVVAMLCTEMFRRRASDQTKIWIPPAQRDGNDNKKDIEYGIF